MTELKIAGQEYTVGPGLLPYLGNVRDGKDEDYRTPLWDGRPREQILDMWDEVLLPHTSDFPGQLARVESEQRDKVGPMSIRLPLSEREDQIRGYWHGFSDAELMLPFDVDRPNRLDALSIEAAAEELAGNTNSGFPRFTRRSKTRDGDIADARSGQWRNYPAILGWRGQSSGLSDDPKQRTVWMFPQSSNIMEMRFFRPLHNWLLANKPNFSAWTTPDEVAVSVERLLQLGGTVISADFSSYDQSVGPSLQHSFFQLMRRMYQRKYENDIDELQEYFANVGLLVQEDDIRTGEHGVPSGSVFTNMCDSLVQFAVISEFGHGLHRDFQVQGDDGLYCFSESVSLDDLGRHFESYGLEFSVDKTEVGVEDAHYLQRYHVKGNIGGIYPTYRALNSLMGQERFYSEDEWGPEMVVIRSIMILENTKHHPLHPQLVRFTMEGDKYGLGSSWPGGLDALLYGSDVLNRAKDIAGFIPSYNQEDRLDGIRSFSTYAIIKEGT